MFTPHSSLRGQISFTPVPFSTFPIYEEPGRKNSFILSQIHLPREDVSWPVLLHKISSPGQPLPGNQGYQGHQYLLLKEQRLSFIFRSEIQH